MAISYDEFLAKLPADQQAKIRAEAAELIAQEKAEREAGPPVIRVRATEAILYGDLEMGRVIFVPKGTFGTLGHLTGFGRDVDEMFTDCVAVSDSKIGHDPVFYKSVRRCRPTVTWDAAPMLEGFSGPNEITADVEGDEASGYCVRTIERRIEQTGVDWDAIEVIS
jgi:hypothetical protein